MSSDQDFGPNLGAAFDFTLTFDQSILSILPSSLLILSTPFVVYYYKRLAHVILSGPLLWSKLCVAVTLFGVSIATLVLSSLPSPRRTILAIASAVVSSVAALCLAACLFMEHRHSLRSSAIISVWLTSSIVFDGAIARSYFLRPDCHDVGAMAVTAAVCKLILMILEEVPKKHFVKDPDTGKPAGQEASSGFWNRALYLWLNKTFYSGFQRVLGVENLDNLGPEFSSEVLAEQFNFAWLQRDDEGNHRLAIACLQILRIPVLSIIPPRLFFTFVTFTQPLFLQAVISALEKDTSVKRKFGLVAAGALLYFGIAISRSLYRHMNYRLVTLVRGILVGAILAKAVTLPYNHAERGSAVTLMSTDIETIEIGLPLLHDTWVNFIELGLGIYLLSRIVGGASFLVLVPTLLSCWSSWYLTKHFPNAKAAWTKSIQTRVATTSMALSQIKMIKMSGMESSVSNQIRHLRSVEIKCSTRTRLLGAMYPVVVMTCKVFTPPIVLAGALYWTTFSGNLTTIGAFSTLAIITLISQPLASIMEAGPVVRSALTSSTRIQAFLLLDEVVTEQPVQALATVSHGKFDEKHTGTYEVEELDITSVNNEKQPVRCMALFSGAFIAVQGKAQTVVLKSLNFTLMEGEFIVVSGPTGCGKSTFLRSLLNETEVVQGSVIIEPGTKSYCDQTPWIRNTSIQENIIGYGDFEPVRYDSVLDACMLKEDIRRLPDGDKSLAGSNGLNLSGGQKHRVAAARALYAQNAVYLFDDIFGALDSTTATEMFRRLFGPDGLLRRLNKTVVLVTSSPQFLEAADRVLLIDTEGRCKVQTDIQDPDFQNELKELLSLNKEVTDRLAQGQKELKTPELGENEQNHNDNNASPPAQPVGDDGRRKGDLWLYWFFVKSIGAFKSAFWLLLTILNALSEKFPDIFLRIWLDHAPDDKVYFAAYVLISLSAVLLTIAVFGFWFASAVPSSLESLHNDLVDTVMRAKLSFLTRTDHGIILNISSQDMTLVSQTLPLIFLRVVYFSFYVLVTMAVVLSGIKYAGTIVPILLSILYGIQHYYLRTSRQVRHLDIESKAPLYTLLTETAAGLLHIRAFGWEPFIVTAGLGLLDTSQKPYYHMFVIQRWLTLVMDLIILAIAMVMLPIAFSIEFSATASGLALSLVTLIQFSDILGIFIQNWTLLETSFGALSRLRHFFQSTPQEARPTGNVDPEWPREGRIIIDNVTARYDSADAGLPILSDISIEAEPGQTIGIVGRTGSGKSSLLLTALHFLDYTGTITIDGVDISTISPELLRSRVPTISQESVDVEATVRDIVCPWLDTLTVEQYNLLEATVVELIWKLNLWSAIRDKGGLDAKVSKLGLSQGQQQLLSIVRGIVRHQATGSKLILMDEPTSNIDFETDKIVQRLFDEKLKGCTIITVAHKPQSISKVDVLYQLTDGRISSKSENQPDAGPKSTWNPDEHRYIGHAGPYESSDDGARLLGTFEGQGLPLQIRQDLQRIQRVRVRDIKRRGLKGEDGRPMTPVTYGQKITLPRFLRETRKHFAKKRKQAEQKQT